MFLAKRLGDRSPYRVSDRPVSLCDITPSIESELGLRVTPRCASIFADGPRAAPRMHFRYPFYQGKKRFRFEKYEVAGHSWLAESWRPATATPAPPAGPSPRED